MVPASQSYGRNDAIILGTQRNAQAPVTCDQPLYGIG
jgi:hypothetical protein